MFFRGAMVENPTEGTKGRHKFCKKINESTHTQDSHRKSRRYIEFIYQKTRTNNTTVPFWPSRY
jgi:hypothetical protein